MTIYTDYIAGTLMHNLQILPDSLMCGTIVLAIALANQSLVVLAMSALGTQLLTGAVGRIIMRMMPDSVEVTSSMDGCTQGFLGRTYDRMMRAPEVPGRMWHPRAPSVFLATLGFFFGYGLGLQQVYKEEIDAQVMNRTALLVTTVIAVMLIVTAVVFRVSAGCESVISAVSGLLFGFMIGYLGCVTLGYVTDRKGTNVWGIPLLRDRINNGSALYICPT